MKTTLWIIISSLILFQCSSIRSKKDLGPSACPSELFVVQSSIELKDHITSSTTALNLDNSYAEIYFSFSETISYTVRIIGSNSGAEFVLEGEGNELAYNWYGNSSNGKYFTKGELLYYSVSNICSKEALSSGQIQLITNPSYNNGLGLTVVSFEPGSTLPYAPYKNGDYTDSKLTYSIINSSASNYDPALPGSSYAYYDAYVPVPEWYLGGQDFSNISYTALSKDPTKVYLNFFAKGSSNTQCYIKITEKLHGTSLYRKILTNVSADWKLYSIKLSDIGIFDPSAISLISIAIQGAQHKDTHLELYLDQMMITEKQPF